MHVFWQRGYAGTAIEDLVKGTGLSRSSLYGTFESKHGLYQCALRRYEAVTTANVELLSRDAPAPDLIRELLLGVVGDELRDPKRRGCMVANASLELAGHDDEVADLVAHNLQRLQKALEALIDRGQQSGSVSSRKPPRALARFFVSTMQGLRVIAKGSRASVRRQALMDVVDVALVALSAD
jgi:TetR/AcrR family transcriptional repressor of nem operon